MSDSMPDRLLKEYSAVFADFDDLTLARWLAQTLGQLQGRAWRFSHPLIGTYRLAAQIAHDRQIWLKRLANIPAGFAPAHCCRSPMLPLFSRDVVQSGLICQHCSETLVTFDDIAADLREPTKKWSEQYAAVHAVAHWDDHQRKSVRNYNDSCEDAAVQAEALMVQAAEQLMPLYLDHYPAILWEDQDECLEVLPEDIVLLK